MSRMPPTMRQGRDWSTNRLSVAELLNTLDLMHDFCVLQKEDETVQTMGNATPIRSTLMILSDRIASETGLACTDTIPYHQRHFDFAQSWAYFEMQHCLQKIIQKVTSITGEATITKTGDILPLIKKMKLILRQLDQ